MSAEAQFIFLGAALILFIVGAVIALLARRVWEGVVAAGLACWVVVPWFHALKLM